MTECRPEQPAFCHEKNRGEMSLEVPVTGGFSLTFRVYFHIIDV